MRKLIYQGSVKDLYQTENGILFEFSDKYSIYDWGEMPDHIQNKGKNLASITSVLFNEIAIGKNFSQLICPSFLSLNNFDQIRNSQTYKEIQQEGFKNHFIKQVDSHSIEVNAVKIEKPLLESGQYNYSKYQSKLEGTLIPLEVVFRFGAPKGSSYLKRNPEIKENSFFNDIKIECYTKLEPKDRLLPQAEAKEISGLTEDEFNEIELRAKILALFLNQKFDKTPLTLWDGKFEFAFGKIKENGNREIILVDTIGPDELRLSFDGIPFSKEFLRQAYQGSTWLSYFQNTNKRDVSPLPLDTTYKHMSEEIYTYLNKVITKGDFELPELLSPLKQRETVVVLGKGGREHALTHHIASSPLVERVYTIPGNPGISGTKYESINIPKDKLVDFCKKENVSYVLIGPEDLLEAGTTDYLQEHGIAVASPSKRASLLESSKAYAKDFMEKFHIPTALYKNFTSQKDALSYIEGQEAQRFVVKLSALAAGKGVILCQTKEEAKSAVKKLSPNDEEIVIEEFLEGREFSYFALCLGDSYQILGTACDYKRLKDGDKGPNTGGMGCYSPSYWVSKEDENLIQKEVIEKTLKGLIEEERSFTGTLFIGIMMTSDGPKVLEYNVRFGDPETQTILPRLKSNLHLTFKAMAIKDMNDFSNAQVHFHDQASVHIVKAAKGYPGTEGEIIEKGQLISLGKNISASKIYYAGVKEKDNDLITHGGRVLGFTTLGDNIEDAIAKAYKNIELCTFNGEQFRKDIGQ